MPESFELIVRDLIAFGLVGLRIESVSEPCGLEFYVDLVRPPAPVALCEEEYYETRERLLRRCVDETSSTLESTAVAALAPLPWTHSVRRRMMREVSRVIRQIQSVGRRAA
jgi:hypothetical protein